MDGPGSHESTDSDDSIERELDMSTSSSLGAEEEEEEAKGSDADGHAAANGSDGRSGIVDVLASGFGIFEAGVIEQIYVQDFMCHRKLTVNFGRHVNFITGANGSGKSAIVAALQLCLGSSAKRTGRGTNLASLIRDGAQSGAVLRVRLINEGEEAFRPEAYGDRITVERKIPRSGQATYALLNSANKVVTTEKAELDRLLAHFNVAVENPCCVLTQDEAKRFIQGKEADKYAFFLKATLLERMKDEIAEAEANLQKAREDQRRNIQQIKLKEQAVNQLEQEAEELEAVERLGFQIAKMSVDIAWATAKEQQGTCKLLEEKISKRQETCEELRRRLAEIQSELDNEVGLSEEEQRRIEAQINDIKDELVKTQAAARTADAEVTDMENTLRRQETAIRRQERRRDELRAELQQRQARATSGANSEVQQKEQEIERLESSNQQLQHSIAEAEASFKHVREQQAEAQSRCEALSRQLQGIQRSIRDGNSEIRRLQSMKTRAGAFGRFAEEIARRVEQHRGMFTGPVLGPVGLSVQLKEEHRDAALAVERVIGRNLGSFVVTNDRDSHQLLRLMREVNRDAAREHSIAVQPATGGRYAVPPIQGAVTVADAISVDDDLIFNLLVDQAQIERVIITDSEEECERSWITRDGRMERFRDSNIAQAVAKDGTLIVIRNGNRSSQSNTNRNQRLGVDVNMQVEMLHQQLQDEQRRAKEVQDALDEASRAQRQLDQEVRQLRTRIDQMRATQRRQGNRMQHLSQELEQLRAELDADLSPFHAEIDALSEEISQMREQYNEMFPQLETLRFAANKKREEVRKVMQRKEALDVELQKLQDAADACIVSRNQLLGRREKAERELAKAQRKLDETVAVLEEQQRELQQLLEYARQQARAVLGEEAGDQDRLDSIDKTTEELQREQRALIATKEREEQRAQRRRVNINQIRERLNTARAEWLATKELIERVTAILADMTHDIAERKANWTRQLASMSRIVETAFDGYMQRKGFSGKVEFDHKNGRLTIRARTDNTDELSQIDDIRQLSGGERSFTTLSLLLALGHVIDCPFRVLDEYDVFLDQIARSITIRQLIEYAQDPLQAGRQFIIITPQDLTAVQTDDKVKIIKMATPER